MNRLGTRRPERPISRPRLRAFGLGTLSAAMYLLAYPPVGLWWAAVLIPVPLMRLALHPGMRPWIAAFLGAMGTLPAWAATHAWVLGVSAVGAPLLMGYLALYTGLFVWAASRLHRRFGLALVVLPLCWVGVEFLRGTVVLTGYPWYFAAHPLIDAPQGVLAAPARWGGVPLVSILAASAAAGIAWGLDRTRAVRGLQWSLATVLVWVGAGTAAIVVGASDPPGRRIVVGIVQPDIPQDNRMAWTPRQRIADWIDLATITVESARDPRLTPDVILWPEGLSPGWTLDPASLAEERDEGVYWSLTPQSEDDAPGLDHLPRSVPATQAVEELLMLQEDIGIPMVVGGPGYDGLDIMKDDEGFFEYDEYEGKYNSVFVLARGRVDGRRYDKMHLTPFGEVMPVISRSDRLESMLLSLGAQGMAFNLSAGRSPTTLRVPSDGDAGPIEIATPICFEATIARVCRRLVFDDGARRAGLMANLTNDGWFAWSDAGRRTHMLTARWRCVELNTPMVRAANTGISSVIDANGRVVRDAVTPVLDDQQDAGYINAAVKLGTGSTLYASIGNAVGWVALAATGAGIVISLFWPSRRATRRADHSNAGAENPPREED